MAGKHTNDRAHTDEHVVEDHHGQSVAAWTAVGILLLASALIALSFPLSSVRYPLLVVGLVLVIVGLVAGKVLASTGFGVGGKGEVTDIADAPEVSNRDDVGIS
jgi:hypothetical protein